MRKPTLLYASPFPPQQSGIADYSEAVVLELRRYFDITLYTANYELKNDELHSFKVLKHGVDRVDPLSYDRRIYQIGNNPWYHSYIYEACLQSPGTVFLHEPVIYYLVAGVYQNQPDFYSRLYRIGGPSVISAIKHASKAGIPLMQLPNPEQFPLNRELLNSKNRFFVHSEYSKAQVEREGPADINVQRMNLADVTPCLRPHSGSNIRTQLGIPPDGILVSSFGHIAATKLNRQICQAVERVNNTRESPTYYVMAGAGDYADQHLSPFIKKTGWISENYADYFHASDLVMNLRYPTMGETSAALLRAMRAAKPCVVTDIGWFSELPAHTVVKLPVSQSELIVDYIYQTLLLFNQKRSAFSEIGLAAGNYASREHNIEYVCRQIAELL